MAWLSATCKNKRIFSNTDEPWLVGNKITYADLSFVAWNSMLDWMFPEGFDVHKEFPLFFAWQRCMTHREEVDKILQMKKDCKETMEDTAAAARHK